MMEISLRNVRLPDGWLATAIGGILGGLGLGTVFGLLSIAYVDNNDRYEGLEGLAIFVLWTAAGVAVGTVAGSAALLRWRGHRRPVVSGIVFALIVFPLLFGLGTFLQWVFSTWDDELRGAISLILSAASAAIGTRALFDRSWHRTDEGT